MFDPISDSPTDNPLNHPTINREWAGWLVGLLDQYKEGWYWFGDQATKDDMYNAVETLQFLLMETGESMALNFFTAYGATTQSYTAPNTLKVVLGSKAEYGLTGWDTDNSRFVASGAMNVLFVAMVKLQTTGKRKVELRHNGAVVAESEIETVAADGSTYNTVICFKALALAGGDTVELHVSNAVYNMTIHRANNATQLLGIGLS